MFSYRNDRLETKAKEPMGPNRNKSRATWQTWQFLATGPLSLSIQQGEVSNPSGSVVSTMFCKAKCGDFRPLPNKNVQM